MSDSEDDIEGEGGRCMVAAAQEVWGQPHCNAHLPLAGASAMHCEWCGNLPPPPAPTCADDDFEEFRQPKPATKSRQRAVPAARAVPAPSGTTSMQTSQQTGSTVGTKRPAGGAAAKKPAAAKTAAALPPKAPAPPPPPPPAEEEMSVSWCC